VVIPIADIFLPLSPTLHHHHILHIPSRVRDGTMLTDRDPNGPVSGRTSRASNLSSRSRMSNVAAGGGKHDVLASTAISSMLRTSTEMGNLVGMPGDSLSGMPRAPQRRGASSRLSTASSLSNHSNHTSRQHRQWPSSSSAPRYSAMREAMPTYTPDTLSPTMVDMPSSPLRAMRSYDRHSHRTLSMTNSVQQPPYRLSGNRSLGSLRGEEPVPRPKSPYHGAYPTRLRRPSYRPASPTWSDRPGASSRRIPGFVGQAQAYPGQSYQPPHPAQPYPHGQARLRIPSDTSLGHQEGAHGMPRRPSRAPSPIYYQGPRPDVPPMPPLHQYYHPAVENARMNRSTKGSVSSRSSNRRTDSDTPSSDLPQPPTPRDGSSMAMLTHPHSQRKFRETVTREVVSSPLYYDYSEQFEAGGFAQPESDAIRTGFVTRIKTVVEELEAVAPTLNINHTPGGQKSDEVVRSDDVAELPASPVARRITRELILKGLQPASTVSTADVTTSAHEVTAQDDASSGQHDEAAMSRPESDETTSMTSEKRHSILSQADSSIVDSTTLKFAVRYSIPMMTGTGIATTSVHALETVPASPVAGSSEKTTSDGMSDLLAGYEHTDDKQEADVLPVALAASDDNVAADDCSGRKSSHAQKSSEAQSFKSCTDVPLTGVLEPSTDEDVKSMKSAPGILVDSETMAKESDARSFKTCKDTITPCRASSVPPSRLSSFVLANSGAPGQQPSLPTPPSVILRKPLPQSRDSNLAVAASKFTASSKPSIKLGSASISGSSSTLNVVKQPPPVPPRESSASKEAQRSNAVGSFLMRHVVPARFSKGKKQLQEDASSIISGSEPSVCEPVSERKGSNESVVVVEQRADLNHALEAATRPQETTSAKKWPIAAPVEFYSSPMPTVSSAKTTPVLHQRWFSNPPKPSQADTISDASLHQHSSSSPTIASPEASSVYSPQDVLSKTRAYTSPAGVPKSPEHNRRDSQTTTHLNWAGRKSHSLPSASVSEPHLPLPSLQEDTTTDLRLSSYRYNGPQHYLPDLKEESHEDSSLNTSASNLKNSHFRLQLQHGGGPGVRASVDDVVMFSRRSSAGSQRRSVVVGRAQALPSMEFSEGNLLERLNRALGSRSLGLLQPDVPQGEEESRERSVSVGHVREKDHDPIVDLDEAEKTEETTQLSTVIDRAQLKRPYSPKIMAEIDQFTIPSVGPLTQRLTDIMPSEALKESLKEYYKHEDLAAPGEFPEEEEIMEHALEEIHHVHPPSQKRSSARLRPFRNHSSLVPCDDDAYEVYEQHENGVVVGDSGDGAANSDHGEVGTHAEQRDENVTHTQRRRLTPLAELEAPLPVLLRPRSNTVSGDPLSRRSVETDLSSRRSLRSFVSTPTATDTRPWNFDRNYPWAATTNHITDISLPQPAATRHSPHRGLSHLRNTFSDATSSTFTSARTPTASPFGTASSSNAKRQSHRLSAFGRSGDQVHAVGERYPTSALSPPTAIFRDPSNCDTSDDEDFTTSRKTRLSFKRLSSRARNSTLTQPTPRVTRSKINPDDLASPAPAHEHSSSTLQDTVGEARAFTSNRHTYRDAEGMRPAVFHRQRLIRSIKRWWHKGGDLIRTFSRRNSSRNRHV
jgi:serine/arginine repetitive matrix protein 2